MICELRRNKFIEDANLIYNNRYDYSLINYINNRTKIEIVCPNHGKFEQTPHKHLMGSGCVKCNVQRIAKNFIKKANIKHNNLYDYSLVNYINCKTKIKIICSIHGIFEQAPDVHLIGCGCKVCGIDNRTKKITHNAEIFINKANLTHDNKYDYSLVEYVNANQKIKIICKKHGIFEQKPSSHLNGRGCFLCGVESRTLNFDVLLLKFRKIHKNSYEYDKSSYYNVTCNMNIYCNKHKFWFKQSPHSHLKGYGCPICRKSNGELKIKNWLDENNVEYEINKTFKNCRNIKVLPFDFYLPKHNILIEYDGEQHFKPKNFGGILYKDANERYNIQKIRDDIKNDFVKKENIKLIRISYIENIVENLNILL